MKFVLMWEEKVVWSVFRLVFGLFVEVEVVEQMIEQKIEG